MDDGEPDPGAARGPGALGVTLEQARDEGLRHPLAGVTDANGHGLRIGGDLDDDRLRAVDLGVADQVAQDLLEPQRVGVDAGAARAVDAEVEVGEAARALAQLQRQVQVCRCDDQVAVLDRRGGEEVLAQEGQPPGQHERALVHPPHELVVESLVVDEKLEVAVQPGERRAHVVADHGGDVVADPLRLQQPAHLRLEVRGADGEPLVEPPGVHQDARRHDRCGEHREQPGPVGRRRRTGRSYTPTQHQLAEPRERRHDRPRLDAGTVAASDPLEAFITPHGPRRQRDRDQEGRADVSGRVEPARALPPRQPRLGPQDVGQGEGQDPDRRPGERSGQHQCPRATSVAVEPDQQGGSERVAERHDRAPARAELHGAESSPAARALLGCGQVVPTCYEPLDFSRRGTSSRSASSSYDVPKVSPHHARRRG